MMRYFFLVLLVSGSIGAVAQQCSPDPSANHDDVSGAVQRWMTNPGFGDGWTDKWISRSGDSVAVAILKTWPDELLDSPAKIKSVLFILRAAFPERQIAIVCSDREPRITMLLLSHLEHLKSAAQLAQDFQITRAAIVKNTGYVYTAPDSKDPQSTPDAYLAWIDSGLRAAADIKPGMTRRELLKTFTTGGDGFGPRHSFPGSALSFIST
jgi:hypothetical protein